MDRNEAIEIHFGAFDSELKGWEYTIPEGYVARIEGNKIILEPKESEDEKIRKGLIDYFDDFHLSTFAGLDPKKILAWLENQGSQNLNNSAKTCKDEQKPAWSEDDDIKALNRISAILVDASEVKNWWKEYRLIERDEMIRLTDFLKSLKDRLQPQQKQEWSEDDEKVLGFILTDLELLFKRNRKSIALFNLETKWLKSLKERYTWKPSEQDIILLERIVNGKSNPQDFQASLQAIIWRLKKLKG